MRYYNQGGCAWIQGKPVGKILQPALLSNVYGLYGRCLRSVMASTTAWHLAKWLPMSPYSDLASMPQSLDADQKTAAKPHIRLVVEINTCFSERLQTAKAKIRAGDEIQAASVLLSRFSGLT